NTSLDRSGDLNLNKLGITGTNFAVGLANTILFNLGGSDSQAASTLLDFSLIQPLLRGAGRARVMEALTQSERTLLANVREFDRFRRNFYLGVALGRTPSAALGGFPRTDAELGVGGYIGLLQAQQEIRNAKFGLTQQAEVVKRFKELADNEQDTIENVTRTESEFFQAQADLLKQEQRYQTAVDRYKISLGLPPTLDIVIDDPYLKQFELISDKLFDSLTQSTKIGENAGNLLNTVDDKFYIEQPDPTEEDPERTRRVKIDFTDPNNAELWPTNLADLIEKLIPILEDAQQELNLIEGNIEQIEADIAKLEDVTPRRIEYLKKFQEAVRTKQIDASIESDSNIFNTDFEGEEKGYFVKTADLRTELRNKRFGDPEDEEKGVPEEDREPNVAETKVKIANLLNLAKQFRATEKQQTKSETVRYIESSFQKTIPERLTDIIGTVNELIRIQAKVRGNSIEMVDVSINSTEATQIARCMRRDWMNARASLVDSWRNIEFVANRLEAQVDLVFDGDVRTRPDASNPFKLRYDTGNLRAGFRFDAPIVRLAERNSYRNALITYQQAKRQYYKFEDSISRSLRVYEREIVLNKTLFEVNRLDLRSSLQTVELQNLNLDNPLNAGRSGSGLANDITRGINALTRAQNSLLQTWLSYEVARLNLDFDMGTMLLDENGRGIDPGPIDSMIGQRAAEALGIELDCQFCDGVAAPGFVAPPLDSRELPSIVDPNPADEPAVEIENRSSRNEFIAPKLGASKPMRPVTRQPMAASKTDVQSVSQLLAAMKNEESASKFEQPVGSDSTSLQTKPQRTNASRTVRSSKTLDPVNLLKTGIVVEPLNQSDADSTEPKKPVSPQRDLSTGKASKPLQKIQTSQLSPIEVVPMRTLQPIKTTEDDPNTNVVVRAYPNPVVEPDSQPRPVDLKMVAIHNPSPANATVKDSTLSEETHWQNQPSSLGGLLNRFSTEANN
ncbi:MAG: TolC family protein, partial [Planctomycetaceae bacterium]|nr:TolC family protein [Planctomycetaceae bacterium]